MLAEAVVVRAERVTERPGPEPGPERVTERPGPALVQRDLLELGPEGLPRISI